MSDYRRAYDLEPKNTSAICALASALIEEDDLSQAIALCDEAIRSDARCANAYYLRGVTRRNQGESGNAIIDLSQALELDPSHANASAALRTLKQIQETWGQNT